MIAQCETCSIVHTYFSRNKYSSHQKVNIDDEIPLQQDCCISLLGEIRLLGIWMVWEKLACKYGMDGPEETSSVQGRNGGT